MTSGYTKALVLTALFAGQAFIANFFMLFLPNVSPAFLVIFIAGYSLGISRGMLSGGLGFFLISYFNPYGMPLLPLLAGQIIFGASVGLCGAVAARITPIKLHSWPTYPLYALWGVLASATYMGGISLIDALLLGPFKQRFLISLGFSMLTIVSNLIIFPLLAPLIKSVREMAGRT
jgi:uncharacterized membrane protein